MRAHAEFCISYGDEMKIISITHEVPTVIFAHQLDNIWEFGMQFHYWSMTASLLSAVKHQQGSFGEAPHLVTHMEDR